MVRRAVLKKSLKNTQVRIQYPVICPVSWVKPYPQSHLATTLVSWTTATHHLENKLRSPTPPFRWLLGTCCLVSQRKHWSQAYFRSPFADHKFQLTDMLVDSTMNHAQGILVGIFWFWKTPRIWCRRDRAFGNLNYLLPTKCGQQQQDEEFK